MGITNNEKTKAAVKKSNAKKHNRRRSCRHLQEKTTKTVNVSTRSGAMVLRSGLRKKNDVPIHIKKEKEDVNRINGMLSKCMDDAADEGEDEDLLNEERKTWSCPKCNRTLQGDDPSCNAIVDGKTCGGRRIAETLIGWGDTLLFTKKPDGAWRCEGCYLSNKPLDTVCVVCEKPKPGVANTVAAGSGAFEFGGVQQQQPPAGVTFGVPSQVTTANSGFTFGQGQQQQTPAKKSGFTFGFGAPTTTTIGSLLASPVANMFK